MINTPDATINEPRLCRLLAMAFETRLASLEREVVQLREQVALSGADAVAARVLAAGSDRDVSEVRTPV